MQSVFLFNWSLMLSQSLRTWAISKTYASIFLFSSSSSVTQNMSLLLLNSIINIFCIWTTAWRTNNLPQPHSRQPTSACLEVVHQVGILSTGSTTYTDLYFYLFFHSMFYSFVSEARRSDACSSCASTNVNKLAWFDWCHTGFECHFVVSLACMVFFLVFF